MTSRLSSARAPSAAKFSSSNPTAGLSGNRAWRASPSRAFASKRAAATSGALSKAMSMAWDRERGPGMDFPGSIADKATGRNAQSRAGRCREDCMQNPSYGQTRLTTEGLAEPEREERGWRAPGSGRSGRGLNAEDDGLESRQGVISGNILSVIDAACGSGGRKFFASRLDGREPREYCSRGGGHGNDIRVSQADIDAGRAGPLHLRQGNIGVLLGRAAILLGGFDCEMAILADAKVEPGKSLRGLEHLEDE